MKRKQVLAITGAGLVLALVSWRWCSSPWPDHEGKLRQTARLSAVMLRRGAEGRVRLAVTAHYAYRYGVGTVAVEDVEPTKLTLVDGAGASQPLSARWKARGIEHEAKLTLPEVPDGDYTLHAEYQTDLGTGEVDLPLALYAPARVHVLTDRPLYEPGHTVRFRAVVVRAADLAPIDKRPGLWVVTDPQGEVVLEEKAPAGEFGVVAGSFPLDRAAAPGTWKVQWRSGAALAEVPFEVKTFTLPRFRVEAAPDLPYYAPNDPATLAAGSPKVRGAVLYSSGAPVANAALEISWAARGDWPMPADWTERLLPRRAATGADGRFALTLPPLPDDLQGQVTLVAQIAAIDPAGDRVEGSASVLLSADGIVASAVTEAGDGLMQGQNNRVYLRVTTPDGRTLPGAAIKVRRAWQANDPGVEATADEDGVAALQLDPGPPVNVVVPAPPYRPAKRPPPVERGEVEELLGDTEATLEDLQELDRWLPALAPCARWADSGPDVLVATNLGLRVSASGALAAVAAGPTAIERCAVAAVRGKHLPAGAERLYRVSLAFRDPGLPSLEVDVIAAADNDASRPIAGAIDAALDERVATARDCLPMAEGLLPRALGWQVTAGARRVSLGPWVALADGSAPEAAAACAAARLAGVTVELDQPAAADAVGVVKLSAHRSVDDQQRRPQPTTMLGYELAVTAQVPGAPSTLLRLPPREVPPLRLRLTPVLAQPGQQVVAELLRGPSFSGELPKKLTLRCPKKNLEAELDAERQARFALPAEVSGWCEVGLGEARALTFVRPAANLAVTLSPDRPTYAPGQQAKLTVRTTSGGAGAKAAVGLVGVDQSLAQLAPLDGPDELAALAPQVATSSPAFGQLDGQALTMGRIAGANAAAAVVLRVASAPTPDELDVAVSAGAQSVLDADTELTERFYVVLSELYAQAKAWEDKAPAKEKMTPDTMARLWKQALAACEQRGQRVDDAFGRRLRLRLLPAELLAQTDPHVVVTGTRLPEDVENWATWVARKRP